MALKALTALRNRRDLTALRDLRDLRDLTALKAPNLRARGQELTCLEAGGTFLSAGF